ncbi:alpha/beta fold hydrolase [Kiloniella laminariae]|uniref:Alpha/beta fold hydrolase n=1 Tax=Kiloniella laminariae TaxID=454162 RepID=A0ABT4LJK7_9PROT|nr:alpha/beta fold hydrolase [Kiloniella laminariae]MCZ4281285.1 alpha/beta fold hydrolase [Kiloniella laminariae]
MLDLTEHTMKSWDQTELFYRAWQPKKKSKKAVILFHRGHEHSGRWQGVIDHLDKGDLNFFAWDARGHGKSPGERGYAKSFDALVKDVDSFVRHISTEYGIAYNDMIILGHSVGSVLVSTWVHDYSPPIRGLILGSPALRVRLYAPFAIPGLRLLQKIKGKTFISSYVKGRLLTHDQEKQRSYDNDPLITPKIAVNILLGLYDAGSRLLADAGAITVPVLILSSGADFVVRQSAQRQFYNGLSNPRKEMQTFPGFLHDTFNEKNSHLPLNKARIFIDDLYARNETLPALLDADKVGYTKDEYDQLKQPLPWYSPKKVCFSLTRSLMKSLGKMSYGIELGWREGFDSGAMLDYVYQNKARGSNPIGKLIDRNFLDSPGWKGIRKRKENLELLLDQTISTLREKGEAVRITELATGQGRYVLDVLRARKDQDVSALLRDFSHDNVREGSNRAKAYNLNNVTFKQGDAFDPASLAEIDNTPNIGIVSGLYELFPENQPVLQSLKGLAEKIQPGGYLIYTNQPWHPQLEFIARVLTSHRNNSDWVMRRRSQQEMDQLVESVGFKKVDMKVDEFGIFTVSLAQKVTAATVSPDTAKTKSAALKVETKAKAKKATLRRKPGTTTKKPVAAKPRAPKTRPTKAKTTDKVTSEN